MFEIEDDDEDQFGWGRYANDGGVYDDEDDDGEEDPYPYNYRDRDDEDEDDDEIDGYARPF